MLALDALRGRNSTSQPGGGTGRGSPAAARRRADRGGQLRGGVGDPGTAAVAATGRRCDVAGHALAEGRRRRGPGGSPGRREGGVSGPAGAPLVRAHSLDVRYPGGVDLLRGLALDVNPGVQMVLTGRSGSGKTIAGRGDHAVGPSLLPPTWRARGLDSVPCRDDSPGRSRGSVANAWW